MTLFRPWTDSQPAPSTVTPSEALPTPVVLKAPPLDPWLPVMLPPPPPFVPWFELYLPPPAALPPRKLRPKKYRCPHCHVAFSNNGQLKGHIRIHTGERPFRCDAENCGKSFTRNEELTRHKKIHSGLRPFACASCGKRFGRKDHLKKHARTHAHALHAWPCPVYAF